MKTIEPNTFMELVSQGFEVEITNNYINEHAIQITITKGSWRYRHMVGGNTLLSIDKPFLSSIESEIVKGCLEYFREDTEIKL